MKKSSFVSNYFYNMIAEMLVLLVPLITTPYVSRVLNAKALGDYGYTSGIVSYFGIVAALGTVNYAKRELAYVQNNSQKRSEVFFELLILRFVTISFAFLVFIFFLNSTSSDLKKLYWIQLITVVSWYFDITWLFGGMEDFKIVSMRNSIVKLLSMALIFIFVKKDSDVWIYTLILSGSLLLGNLSALPYAKKYIKKVNFKKLKPYKHLKGVLSLFTSVVAVQLYTVLDQTMLGSIINTTEVGYYIQAQKIIRVALTIIGSFALVLLPRIANLYRNKNTEEMNKYWRISIDYLFMLALPLMVGCVLCSKKFVPLFYGPGYDPVGVLLIILSILFVILGLGQILGTLLTAIDKQLYATISVSCGAVINIGLNLFLIKRMNAAGACVASVIAETVVTLIQSFFLKNEFDFKYLTKSFSRYFIPSAIMGCTVFGVGLLEFNEWFGIIVQVLMGVLVYFSFLLFSREPLTKDLLGRIINKFSRENR